MAHGCPLTPSQVADLHLGAHVTQLWKVAYLKLSFLTGFFQGCRHISLRKSERKEVGARASSFDFNVFSLLSFSLSIFSFFFSHLRDRLIAAKFSRKPIVLKVNLTFNFFLNALNTTPSITHGLLNDKASAKRSFSRYFR